MGNTIARHRRYPASEGKRFSGDTTLVTVECPTCFVTYAIPEGFHNSACKHNSAKNPDNYWRICCPFGHEWWYSGLNREQRLEAEARRERERAGRMAAERDQARASAKAQKGAATRARNERNRAHVRAKAGVCQCCGRTFKQLARHMESQHPDFKPGGADGE